MMANYIKEFQYFVKKEVELNGSFTPEDFLVLIGEFDYYELQKNHLIHDRGDNTESYKGLTLRVIKEIDCFHIISKTLCKSYITDVLTSFFESPDGIGYAREVAKKDRFDRLNRSLKS